MHNKRSNVLRRCSLPSHAKHTPSSRARLSAPALWPLLLFVLFIAQGAQSPAATASGQPPPLVSGSGLRHFRIDPEASRLTFFLKGNIHDTEGTVSGLTGEASSMISSNGNLTDPTVHFRFAAKNMDTRNSQRDKRMKEKFLEIAAYPEIVFQSRGSTFEPGSARPLLSATPDAPIAFELQGLLRIHGTTNRVGVPVNVWPDGDRLIAEGQTSLNLKDYGIKNPSLLVFRTEDIVRIGFHVALAETPAPRLSVPDGASPAQALTAPAGR